jgi:tetratricopeptide (TPR) repeat protein
MGGLGKTALANKAATQLVDEYPGGIFWAALAAVKGEVKSIFHTWASICGTELFTEQETTDFAYLIRNILTIYTNEHGRILIVIDDVRDEWLANARLLRNAAPQNSSTLLTTRNIEIAKALGASSINLKVMNTSEAVAMLSLFIDMPITEQEITCIKKLLKGLGYLPLAVELAGKRISILQHKPSFSLEQFVAEVIARASVKLQVKGHQGLAATFSITYDSLEIASQIVFKKLSIFATNLIATEQAAAVVGLDNEDTVNILDDMVMQSLLQWGEIEGEYVIHPLLKQFATQLFECDTDEQNQTKVCYIDFFTKYTIDNVTATMAEQQLLQTVLPDILKALELAVELKNDRATNRLVMALCSDSRFLYTRGYAVESLRILTAAVQVCSRNGWLEDEVIHLVEMGVAYSHLGDVALAIDAYQSARALNNQTERPETVGACSNNLGLIYFEMGQLKQADKYFAQALRIAEAHYEINLAIDVLGSLGSVQRMLGNIIEARNYFDRSLQLAKVAKVRLSEGNALSNLGLTYQDEKNYENALNYINQGLAVAREINDRRGEENRLGHLGNIYGLKGSPKQAITYFTSAIDISRAISHRFNEGNWTGNLGNSYRQLGNPGKAIDLYKQALSISREVRARSQELIWLMNLGLTYRDLQKWELAIKFLNKSALVCEELKDYSKYQAVMGNVASIYKYLGKGRELHSCYEKQLKSSQAVGDHETSSLLLNQLGEMVLFAGEIERSKVYFTKALIASKKINNKILEGASLSNLALNTKNRGDLHGAIDLYLQAIECQEKTDNKILTGIAIAELGAVYIGGGQFAKGIDNLHKAMAIFKNAKFVEKNAFVLGNLGNAYYGKGEVEKAVEYHEQALVISGSKNDNMNIVNWQGALGHDYLSLGDYKKAKELYAECIAISRLEHIPSLEARSALGLGIVNHELSEISISNQHLRKALSLARQLKDKRLEAECLFNIGTNFIVNGEIKKAHKHFEQARQVSRQVNDTISEASALWALGMLLETDDYTAALQYLRAAVVIFKENDNPMIEEYAAKLVEVESKTVGSKASCDY